jgi:ABC-2 type transport system ATP-binding protein
MTMETTIELRSLGKTYRPRAGQAVAAIRDLELTIAAEQAVGIVGPRGAGKTTIIKLLGGLIKPTAGSVRLRGYDLRAEHDAALRQVGVLMTDRAMRSRHRSIWEHLAQSGRAHGLEPAVLEARIEAVLHGMNLSAYRHSGLHTLSPGQRRLVALGGAMVADPPILLFDEPTRDLDGAEARTVLAAVRNITRGRTIVLATAHIAIAYDLCERVVVLNGGQIVGERARAELLSLFRQERYTIRVKGHLSAAWSEWFDGLTVVNEDAGEAVISGQIPDQSALHGVLARIHALNLPLLNVSRTEPSLDDVFAQLYGRPAVDV